MSNGLIGTSDTGAAEQPSGIVWGDCPNTLLPDKGLGYFLFQDWVGDYSTVATTVVPGIQTFTGAGTTAVANAASGTYGPNVIQMASGAADNDTVAVYGNEFGQIVRNSGKKFWFETRIALAALGDAAFFAGLTTLAGATTTTTGLLAANPSNSAAATTIGVSNIGFISVQAASAIATANAVYKKAAGTAVTVLANATNGVGIPIANRSNIVAQTFIKFGIRFDGYKLLHFYVNGYQVAKQEVDSTVDQTAYYVPIVVVKAGTTTAITSLIDWVRAGFQARA